MSGCGLPTLWWETVIYQKSDVTIWCFKISLYWLLSYNTVGSSEYCFICVPCISLPVPPQPLPAIRIRRIPSAIPHFLFSSLWQLLLFPLNVFLLFFPVHLTWRFIFHIWKKPPSNCLSLSDLLSLA